MDTRQTPQKVLIRQFKPRDIVVSEDVAADRFFVILQGSVEILKEDTSIRVLHQGDVFGIEQYYLKKPCPITAKTLTAARIAAYHIDLINDIIYENPKLTHRLLTSVVRQLAETSLTAARTLPGSTPVDLDGLKIENMPPASAAPAEELPEMQFENLDAFKLVDSPAPESEQEHNRSSAAAGAPKPTAFPQDDTSACALHDEVLSFFLDESSALLRELELVGEKLKLVGIPNEQESQKLVDFAQKLNRLIGGTASMGFHQFSHLSRKTSLIAVRCAEIREMTIRILISNLNLVVSVLADCFQDLDSIKRAEQMIPHLDQRLDICMVALGIEHPDIQNQSDIDAILERYRAENQA
jgi:hypothetical protein